MAKLRYLGDQVFQTHDKGRFFKVWPNGVIEVSDERAAKLEQDYPDQWEDAKNAAVSPGDVPKPQGQMPAGKNKAAKADVEKGKK